MVMQQIKKLGLLQFRVFERYVEEQLTREGKQMLIYSIDEASHVEDINIAVISKQYQEFLLRTLSKIEALLIGIVNKKLNIEEVKEVAINLDEIIKRDPNNSLANDYKQRLSKILNEKSQLITNWVDDNLRKHRQEIDSISNALFFRLYQVGNKLYFENIIKKDPDQFSLDLLEILLDEINFGSSDIETFMRRIRSSVRKIRDEELENEHLQ